MKFVTQIEDSLNINLSKLQLYAKSWMHAEIKHFWSFFFTLLDSLDSVSDFIIFRQFWQKVNKIFPIDQTVLVKCVNKFHAKMDMRL